MCDGWPERAATDDVDEDLLRGLEAAFHALPAGERALIEAELSASRMTLACWVGKALIERGLFPPRRLH